MANVRTKSDKITPFGGMFSSLERFDALLSETIDSTLGLRITRNGYSCSEIFRSLMCAYHCGGSCAEDISNHLLKHLCSHPKLRTCSSDTILRAFNELATENILTNDYRSSEFEIVEFYKQRGGKESVFDEMNNSFGWSRLPKSFMAENSAFLAITALIHNFYKHIMRAEAFEQFGLNVASRVKAFVFKFVSVPAKWVRMARQHVLNIYTSNPAYSSLFKKESG